MASVEIEIGGRRYTVACRDGEEAQLKSVASIVDKRARDAASALGSLPEAQLLLFTALMLADDVSEMRNGGSGPPAEDPALANALERLAERVEALAERVEA
jgi:cell division protein ZapA